QFLVLGRSIERADMTARLIATRAVAGSAAPGWTTMLRSCGAYEAYLRTYRGREADRLAAEFLLLDPSFPRSVVYSLMRAESCLETLERGARRRGEEDARTVTASYNEARMRPLQLPRQKDRKSTRLNSSHVKISYAVFCLKKKNRIIESIQSLPRT